MTRVLLRLCLGIALVPIFFAASPVANVGAEIVDADAWVSISATKPEAGCLIDVAIEVRSGGEALVDADVQTALHIDDHLISADRTLTNDNGIAFLTVDTTGLDGGDGAWMDINVGSVYLKGVAINVQSSGGCAVEGKSLRLDGDVGYEPAPAGAGIADDGTFWVPEYKQQRGLSCEYAALHIATEAWGDPVSEYAFDETVGWSSNPHLGYRGDIEGRWGGTTDYGVYAKPLSWALPAFGYEGIPFYGAGSTVELTKHLDEGAPVLVWMALYGDESEVIFEDGMRYTLVPGMHVMVAHGYDDDGIYVSDPGTGRYRFYKWGDFMYYWNVLDGMGLAVYPE